MLYYQFIKWHIAAEFKFLLLYLYYITTAVTFCYTVQIKLCSISASE